MKGQTVTGLLLTVGGAALTIILGWNSWLSFTVFTDHADLHSLITSVSDLQDSVKNDVLPTLHSIASRQVYTSRYGTTTNE